MSILFLPHEYSQQRQREKKRCIYPIRLAMEATYYAKQGEKVYWDEDWDDYFIKNFVDRVVREPVGLPFLSLPHADRTLTKAHSKRYQQNGNFKFRPGTYIQAANGCWWGKCRFCVETQNKWEVREVDDVIDEIKECRAMGFREVFDDSGTFPIGGWLDEFCRKLSDIGIRFSCNMRAVDLDYVQLRKAGFRMLLFGLESANEETLRRIRKGTANENIQNIIKASLAGLEPHIAVMFGHPCETDEDAVRTLRLVWELLRKGYAKTAQASFYSPQKETPAGEKGEKGQESHRKYVNQIYRVGFSPEFWANRLRCISSVEDIRYLLRGIKAALNG